MPKYSDPPRPDEFEISLFGPGVGECVVMHFPGGDWVIVDSCRNSKRDLPVAVEYLQALGVSIPERVRMLIVTHMHDDHIRGASDILDLAPQAELVLSSALLRDEFMTLVTMSREFTSTQVSSGVDELRYIFERLAAREEGVRSAARGPTWAMAGQRLLQGISPAGVPFEVFALSPSSGSITLALKEISRLIPEIRKGRRATPQSENEVSVALHAKCGDLSVVLGSDLEVTPDLGTGWRAVVSSNSRPREKARIVKVPHHGSKNADLHEFWDQMVEPSAHALVAPYRPSKLPKSSDLNRLLGRTKDVFLTANVRGGKSPKRAPAVERTLREGGFKLRTIEGQTGHVRVRVLPSSIGYVAIDLFAGAVRVA